MKTKLFDYSLPPELVAQTPLPERDKSRLLVCQRSDRSIHDCFFYQLPYIIKEVFQKKKPKLPVLFIANNSRVYKARVRITRKTGAQGEVFLLEKGTGSTFHCLLRPQNKLKVGEILYARPRAFSAEAIPLFQVMNLEPPAVSLLAATPLETILETYGEMPLPPYILRKGQADDYNTLDQERYQTVYAEREKAHSAAAPTAGLHFTPTLIADCEKQGAEFVYVTLHVGQGTFAPVQTQDIENHHMHSEKFFVTEQAVDKICLYLKKKWPIVFVGTTSLRTMESLFRLAFLNTAKEEISRLAEHEQLKKHLSPYMGRLLATDLFIHPEKEKPLFSPLLGDALLTNFHQQESTLVMLVSALMGHAFWKDFYDHAIKQRYRFLSYGDSNLLIFGDRFS